MDAQSDAKTIALAVDLDGTLIATDLLWEGLFQLARTNPLFLFLLPYWLIKGGKASLKWEIARRISLDPTLLPYRAGIIDEIRAAKAAGRPVILATGSPRRFAEAISAHLGLFDQVLASSETVNLTSARKRNLLVETFGDGGFDYMGNSRADIAIFDAARQAFVVAPDRAAARWAGENDARRVSGETVTVRTVARMMRVHQWAKNLLIAVPMILSHEYFNPAMILESVLAFVAFSATASAIYIANDCFDLPLDRRHATKRFRPLASGQISIAYGMRTIAVLLSVAVVAAAPLDVEFWGILGAYLLATSAYSVFLKRMLLIDVLTLAGLYTVRLLAGAAATGTTVSFWLLAFSVFFFLSLALVKRFVELQDAVQAEGETVAGRGYRREDFEVISQAGLGSAFAATLVLALYIDSSAVRELYRAPWLIWPLAPIVLYIILRIWVLARRGEMHDDPVVFIMNDWRSQLMAAAGVVLIFLAAR